MYPSSIVASAIVVVSRRALQITPLWRPELAALLGYEHAQFEECAERIWSEYHRMYPSKHASRDSQPSPKDVADVASA